MPVVAPGDIEGIHALLADRYDRFVRGERPAPLAGREQFARGTQAGRFFSAIVERRVRGAAP